MEAFLFRRWLSYLLPSSFQSHGSLFIRDFLSPFSSSLILFYFLFYKYLSRVFPFLMGSRCVFILSRVFCVLCAVSGPRLTLVADDTRLCFLGLPLSYLISTYISSHLAATPPHHHHPTPYFHVKPPNHPHVGAMHVSITTYGFRVLASVHIFFHHPPFLDRMGPCLIMLISRFRARA